MQCWSRDRWTRICIAAVAALFLFGARGLAQRPAANTRRGADEPLAREFKPDQFFENLFGGSSSEQQAALAKIVISPADERRFGNSIVEAYLAELRGQQLKIIERGRDIEYLRDLVNTVRPLMKNHQRYRTIKLYVVDSAQIDARSFPGGTLFFFRGLLDFADSEAALIGIVGHELSHLDHGHQLGPLRRMAQLEEVVAGSAQGASPDRMFSAIRTMVEGYARPFRPEDESEADRDGAAWAFRAGYDPREMAELFLRLHRRDGEPATLSFLQTHPFRLDRYRAVKQQYAELQQASPAKDLYVGRRNLTQRVSRAKHDFEGN